MSEAIEQSGAERFSDEGRAAEHAALAAAKMIAVDGSGYYAALRTAPDFGCVLWEAMAPQGRQHWRE